jgi:hypothetical protein
VARVPSTTISSTRVLLWILHPRSLSFFSSGPMIFCWILPLSSHNSGERLPKVWSRKLRYEDADVLAACTDQITMMMKSCIATTRSVA